MTDDLPAIRADLVKISTLARGFTQLVLEIPSEQAAKAIELLGVPTPGNSLWVAIAPLGDTDSAEKPRPVSKQPEARKGYWEKKPSQRAWQLCGNAAFERYANKVMGAPLQKTPNDLAAWLRDHLGVSSRSDLDCMSDSHPILKHFLGIEENFRQWVGYEASPERIPDQVRKPSEAPPNAAPPEAAPVASETAATPAAEGADKRQGIPELSPGELMRQVQERDGR